MRDIKIYRYIFNQSYRLVLGGAVNTEEIVLLKPNVKPAQTLLTSEVALGVVAV